MNVYCKKFSSGRISHFLMATQLHSGRWTIATKSFNEVEYTPNINYPVFETQAAAVKYLRENFEEV